MSLLGSRLPPGEERGAGEREGVVHEKDENVERDAEVAEAPPSEHDAVERVRRAGERRLVRRPEAFGNFLKEESPL